MAQITYSDDTIKNFSENGKSFVSSEIVEDTLNLAVYFNKVDENGVGISEKYSLDMTNPNNASFIADLAARGAKDYIVTSLNVAKTFDDSVETDPETGKEKTTLGLFTIVKKKISELVEKRLVSRTSGEGSTSAPLSRLELAYARTYNLNPECPEDYKSIHNWYLAQVEANPNFKRSKPQLGDDIFLAYEEISLEIEKEKAKVKELERQAREQALAALKAQQAA